MHIRTTFGNNNHSCHGTLVCPAQPAISVNPWSWHLVWNHQFGRATCHVFLPHQKQPNMPTERVKLFTTGALFGKEPAVPILGHLQVKLLPHIGCHGLPTTLEHAMRSVQLALCSSRLLPLSAGETFLSKHLPLSSNAILQCRCT